jgi:hypothetical protein
MSMPGFTGEASLYKTSGHYHMVGAEAIVTAQAVPQLAQVIWSPVWASLLKLTCLDMVSRCLAQCASVPNIMNHKYACMDCCTDKHECCVYQVGLGGGGFFAFPASPKCDIPPYTYPYPCQ